MSENIRKYVDYEGLKHFKTKLDGKFVDLYDYVNNLLDGAIVKKQVFYALDENLDRIPVYEEAEGEASGDIVYYERSGNGSVSSPYVYTAADPQPAPGSTLEEGLYYQTGDYETTLVKTDDPVLDPETGEPVYVDASILDGYCEISEAEVRELFEEGN